MELLLEWKMKGSNNSETDLQKSKSNILMKSSTMRYELHTIVHSRKDNM